MTSVIAHRGASGRAPANTLSAFRLAAELGADAVELDVRRSADGALVVIHDAYLPDGRAVGELRRDELPAEICELDEALAACGQMWVNVEIKNASDEPGFDATDAIAAQVAAVIGDWGHPDRVVVSSFRPATIAASRDAAPYLPTAYLCFHPDEAAIAACVEGGHRMIHPWVAALADGDIERCHAAGLQVNTWTCNDPDRMAALIAAGIDGIITDVPDVAAALRASLGAGDLT